MNFKHKNTSSKNIDHRNLKNIDYRNSKNIDHRNSKNIDYRNSKNIEYRNLKNTDSIKFVLYVYNLNYKIKLKWLKYELHKIISRKIKSFKIRMTNKMEGQAFIDFTNKNDMVECNKLLDGLFLHNRKIISAEVLKKR